MRTIFDIVLGILLTVAKACLHAMASTAGVLAFCAVLAMGAMYVRRWRARHAALLPGPGPRDESNVISIED
jgi:hypothetical protein